MFEWIVRERESKSTELAHKDGRYGSSVKLLCLFFIDLYFRESRLLGYVALKEK